MRVPKIITKTLTVRLSLIVVSSMAILLMGALIVMLHFSRKALKEEALQKAAQTLEATVQCIDNILLSVEQTTGNVFFGLMRHLNNPYMVDAYSRKVVESNPYVAGCAIAFREDFYADKPLFMSYYHRSEPGDRIVRSETFADSPYTEQPWFTVPMATGRAAWLNPLAGMKSDVEPIITFCLPIRGFDGKMVGVVGVDVSLSLLSRVVLDAKPSPHSYCTLIDSCGSFIVHPDSNKLFRQTIYTQLERGADASVGDAANAMVSGATGYKSFSMNGNDYCVFFKPFERAVVPGRTSEKLGWSVGVVYSEDDIFGDYNALAYYVLAIAAGGLLLLFMFSRVIIRRQLRPLAMLTKKAQLIAQGKYDEPIPDSQREDEIGRLQDNFKHMQQTLSSHIGELEQLTTTLQERGNVLRAAYDRAQKADRMKTAFLHNMTDQMSAPADAIARDVDTLCGVSRDTAERNTSQLVSDIQQNGNAIADLLDNLINMSDEEIRKEVAHD